MSIRDEIIKQLKKDNPKIRSGDDDAGYTEFSPTEYAATIEMWADNVMAEQSAIEQAAINKAALLAKLGITADEAKLLLS